MTTDPEPLTKRQIIERDEPLLTAHPLREWLRHGEHCPARRMRADMLAVDGPCDCGLTATLDEARPTGPDDLAGLLDVFAREAKEEGIPFVVADRIGRKMAASGGPRSKSGRTIDSDDLADRAEAGFDLSTWTPRSRPMTTEPTPDLRSAAQAVLDSEDWRSGYDDWKLPGPGVRSSEVDGRDYEQMRRERGWPTPNHMRATADALDVLTPARYGEVLRWFADLCDATPTEDTGPQETDRE